MTGDLADWAPQHNASIKFLNDSVQWKIPSGTAVDQHEIEDTADALNATRWTAHFYSDGGDSYLEYHLDE